MAENRLAPSFKPYLYHRANYENCGVDIESTNCPFTLIKLDQAPNSTAILQCYRYDDENGPVEYFVADLSQCKVQ